MKQACKNNSKQQQQLAALKTYKTLQKSLQNSVYKNSYNKKELHVEINKTH